MLGNGSNDVLELVGAPSSQPGDPRCSRSTRSPSIRSSSRRAARAVEVPAKDYGHDLEAMVKAMTRETRDRLPRQPEQSDRHAAIRAEGS